ncbi:hypothetical protein GF386_03930 [Candidatus Pacearchaeota archaeon]|nr:hypothetical protein [Candidatus Pacearchaeota archaeon]MBD3283297.1 hypothetical protein [Candidatus Pacearchaeota archaeon]
MDDLKLVWAGADPSGFSSDEISNKSLGLLELSLLQKEFPFIVPGFFVIPTSFYSDYWKKHELGAKIQVESLDDINDLFRDSQGMFFSSLAPPQIRDFFKDFYTDYKAVLEPAFLQVSGQKLLREHQELVSRRYPDFLKVTERPMDADEYQELVTDFKRRFPTFDRDMILRRILWENTIDGCLCRSASPLEGSEDPFPGVFNSFPFEGSNFEESEASFALVNVLTSSFSPYAQFYMENRNVSDRRREIAGIVQRRVRHFKDFARGISTFCGTIEVAGNVVIKYSCARPGFTECYVEIENSDIVRYDNKDATVGVERYENPFATDSPSEIKHVPRPRIGDERLLRMAAMSRKLVGRIRERKKLKFDPGCFEFVIGKDRLLRLVQARKLYGGERHNHRERLLPDIPEERVICRDLVAHTVGDCRGPFVNIAKYNTDSNSRGTNFGNLTAEDVRKLDEQYPGAVYLVNPFQFAISPDKVLRGKPEEMGKAFYMLTPRKRGLIIFNTDATWDHLDTVYELDRVMVGMLKTSDSNHPLMKLEDGVEVGLCLNGRDGVVYRP